ncbi:minor tail protein [Microbacterium phage SBlackberry]|nr:minor tail protein [Microbacterium phage SBlackberry]
MRSIAIASAGGSLQLDGTEGYAAKLAVRGTGMVGVSVQWAEGAGDGKSFRGGKTLARQFEMPVKIYADPDNWEDRELVRQRYAKLAQILSLRNAPVRVTIDLDAGSPEGDRWFADMVRVGGGSFDWDKDTDGRSFIKTTFTLEAGDPYWTSEDQESKVIQPTGVGLGILGPGISLTQLRVGSTSGFGDTTITNTGEVEAYPVWTFEAPFSSFVMTSEYGETLEWVGAVAKSTGYIRVNTQDGTVVDETGANRYAELGDAPQFWAVNPGITDASVVLADAGAGTRATVIWARRREVLF